MTTPNVELIQKSGYLFLNQKEGTKLEELAKMMIGEAKARNSTVCAVHKGFELMAFPDNTPEYLIGFYRGYIHRTHGNFRSMRYSQKH